MRSRGSITTITVEVDLPLLRNTLRLARYQFTICGPKPMMEGLVPGLEEWGVDSGDIHYESFGPATLVKQEKPAPAVADAQPVSITFSRSGKHLTWDSAAGSLSLPSPTVSTWTRGATPAAAVRAQTVLAARSNSASSQTPTSSQGHACCVLPRPVAISYWKA
ncbi:MAG: hypothetical protein R3E46_14715 [Sedimenticolaceae bacterium]